MPLLRNLGFTLLLAFGTLGLAACDDPDEGAAERAGESVDNAAERAGEAVENAGERIQNQAQ